MSEHIPQQHEESGCIPSREEILNLFSEITDGRECTTERVREDEHGIYLWEVSIPTEDGHEELSYVRSGTYPECQSLETVIDKIFYDTDGTPIGGENIMKYKNGSWEKNP